MFLSFQTFCPLHQILRLFSLWEARSMWHRCPGSYPPSPWLQWWAQRWAHDLSQPIGVLLGFSHQSCERKWSLSAERWFWGSSKHWYHHVEKACLKNKPSRTKRRKKTLSWIKLFLKPDVTLDFPGTQMKISSLLHKLDWVGFLSLKMEDSWPIQDSKRRWYVLFACFLQSQHVIYWSL